MATTPPDRPFSDLVVIFDLDGTLVDSAPDLTEAMNVILGEEGMAPLPEREVRHLVGEGARALLRRGYAEHGRRFPEGEEGDVLVTRYVDRYAARIAERTRPFGGCEDALAQLAEAGAALAVCTNKVEKLAFPLLDALDLTKWFDVVLARDSLDRCKPDPAPLIEIQRRTGRARGVMIGDTPTDLAAGRAAGMPVLLAEFGYGSFETSHAVKDEQRFEDFEALFEKIRSLGGRTGDVS
ncbi:HAD-IA family hydrolase [Parvularcula dongshanensis]|uniref:phosphoglycolate phosphatase n=1 Tax=Parvularcula dongshanensis TaxID=1173995 RepID=A0A840I2M1_9PROT|nr:HAD-IA family hydrolase [Parvularcula dongshanensis]MBB4658438.1 phosphoglycolate phosphatase [Parvularcula dongshanensis]